MFILGGVYFFLRLYRLGFFPLFLDEAIYLDWARQIWLTPGKHLFISFTDGKQPLFIWLATGLYGFFVEAPAWAGRLISVLAGFGSIVTLWWGMPLIKPSILLRILTVSLYILSPLFLWYDRLSLMESLLFFSFTLSFFLTLAQPGLWHSVGLGLAVAIALWTKSTALSLILLVPLTIGLNRLSGYSRIQDLKPWFLAGLMSVVLTLPLWWFQSQIQAKNDVFLLTLTEWGQEPFQVVRNNIYSLWLWLRDYQLAPLTVIAVVGLYKLWHANPRLAVTLALWGIVPLLPSLFLAKIFFPRYIIVAFLPWTLLAAYGLHALYGAAKRTVQPVLAGILVLACLIPLAQNDFKLISGDWSASLPQVERWQYLEGWPSGFGIDDTIAYLIQHPPQRLITEDFTLLESTLALYHDRFSNFVIEPILQVKNGQLIGLPEILDDQTYILLSDIAPVPESWTLQVINRSPRIGNRSAVTLYKTADTP